VKVSLKIGVFLAIAFFVNLEQSLAAQTEQKIDSLLFLYETAPNDSTRVRKLIEASNLYAFTDIQNAISFAEKALAVAEKSSDKNLHHRSIFNMGIVYFQLGAIEISANYFFRYLDIMKENDHKQGIAAVETNLGAVYLMLQQYEQSREYFESALAYYETLPIDETKMTPLHELYTLCNNLGIVYQKLDDLDKSVEYYNRGVVLAKRHYMGDRMLAMLLNNLGSVFIEQNSPEMAYKYLSEAYEIRIRNNDVTGLAQSYRMYGRYYIAIHDYNSAIENLNNGWALSVQVGNMTLESENLNFLYQAWVGLKQADSALKYFMLFTNLKEKINKEAALKELTQLELTARYNEREKMMQLEQKRREMFYRFVALTLVLSLAILGLLFFLSQSRNRRLKLEKELINLNAKNLALENTNLESQLAIKNKELTTNVMYQIQKNELIQGIVQKLQKFAKSDIKPGEREIIEIIRNLEKTQDQPLWNGFEVRFQQVHNDFYNRLNEINPELSVNERRLCAFLRLNMTTKEISAITGQSPRTIDVARTRLRKKLNLTNSETGLVEFLSTI